MTKRNRPLKTGEGRGFGTPVVLPDQQYKNGLASVYVGPMRESPVIHLVTANGDTIFCMPTLPAGRLVPRPEAEKATCFSCIQGAHSALERLQQSLGRI